MGFIEKKFKQDILRNRSKEDLFAKHKINFEIMRRRASMTKWSKLLLYFGLVIFIASLIGNNDLKALGTILALVLVFFGVFLGMYGFFWNEMFKIYDGEEQEKDDIFHDG